jgi:hypothetical protein
MAAQTDGSIGAGTHFVEGSNLVAAFSNPRKLDLIQVVNSGGKVAWNLSRTARCMRTHFHRRVVRSWGNFAGLLSLRLLRKIRCHTMFFKW